ncbi:hypothetical protein F8M41_014684 [Gigaspora margarita]|uniref:Uncharacterized protein n=1 Tax=Gigaspora margarita TaxID=4874 RepID=A0A8H4ARL6_GIGMA|nr:hypothetical protein F8M41_014684 [Gigaspora margarita]
MGCPTGQPIVHAQYEPLARLWRVNDTDLLIYLTCEKILKNLDRTIFKLLDDSNFGGTWIDVKANKLTINTINFTEAVDIRLNNVVIYSEQSENNNTNKEIIDATKPYNLIIIYENPVQPIMKQQKHGLIRRRILYGEGLYRFEDDFWCSTEMYSASGDSGGPVYFYSKNLNSVSLNGIVIACFITTNDSNDITAILLLDIILSQVKIIPILSL